MAQVRYWANSTIVYSGTSSVSATVPGTIGAGDYLLRFVAAKAATAISVPSGWTDHGSFISTVGVGSAADVGDVRIAVMGKVADGTEVGTTQTINLTGNTAAWTVCYTMRKSSANVSDPTYVWGIDAYFAQDATGDGTVSATFSAIDIAATDFFMVAFAIPTDVTTPSQFTAEAISATGITFGTMTEMAEPDSTTGDDIGGVTFRQPVSSGSSGSVAPTVTMTAAATNTNVYGPLALVRLREVQLEAHSGSLDVSGSGTMDGAGLPGPAGALGLDGSGALSGAGEPAIGSTLGLSGSGTASTVGVPAIDSSLALDGSGTATTVGEPATGSALGLDGSGTATASGEPAPGATLGLDGSGALTLDGVGSGPGSLTVSGAGSLAVAGVPVVGDSTDLDGSGTFESAGSPSPSGGPATSGDGDLSLVAVPRMTGTLVLTGGGLLELVSLGAPRDITVEVSALARRTLIANQIVRDRATMLSARRYSIRRVP